MIIRIAANQNRCFHYRSETDFLPCFTLSMNNRIVNLSFVRRLFGSFAGCCAFVEISQLARSTENNSS